VYSSKTQTLPDTPQLKRDGKRQDFRLAKGVNNSAILFSDYSRKGRAGVNCRRVSKIKPPRPLSRWIMSLCACHANRVSILGWAGPRPWSLKCSSASTLPKTFRTTGSAPGTPAIFIERPLGTEVQMYLRSSTRARARARFLSHVPVSFWSRCD